MQPLEIKKDIYWIGAVDFGSMDFHGYSLSPKGSTYNSYLVKDEKIVLFDTVKHDFLSTMLARMSQVTNPESIDYFVINHVELDHSGCLPELVKICKPEKIFCSPMGLKAMQAHFDTTGWPIEVKKTGDTLCIGKRTIHFLETRMLHWPDSMFSYIDTDKLLISNDAFGQNIASTVRYSDEVDPAMLEFAMREYYHNIVLPYSPQVLKVLDHVTALKLEIDMIAPDHGLIFRTKEQVNMVLETYRKYALQQTQNKALIVFDTMWHSTEKMAYAISEGLHLAGVESRIMDLKQHHHSTVMTELSRCGLVIVGSPTHNNGIMPNVARMLTYMKGLRPQNRLGAAFGSYGWSGESVNVIHERLTQMGMEMPVPALKTQYVPKAEFLKQCEEVGKTLGEALLVKVAADAKRLL